MPHGGLQRSRTPKQRNLRVLHVWWAAANWLRSDSRRAAVSLLQSCDDAPKNTRDARVCAVDAVDAVASELTHHGPRRHRRESQRSRAAGTMLFKSAIKSAFAAHAPLTRTNLAVGDSIPAGTTLVKEFPNELVDVPARLAGKKTIVVGLPGAFTPT